jgi:hypothetical protein
MEVRTIIQKENNYLGKNLLSNRSRLLCCLLAFSMLTFAACSLPLVSSAQKDIRPDCRLTVPIINVKNSITIDNAHLCYSSQENWIEYTNTTQHSLSAISICARALNQSGAPYGKSYCGTASVLKPGQKIVTPHFPGEEGTYGITAVAKEAARPYSITSTE